jgi:hypothetical protein
MPNVRDLVEKAKRFFPHSKGMRKAWVRKTIALHQSGRHALNTGGWKNGGRV